MTVPPLSINDLGGNSHKSHAFIIFLYNIQNSETMKKYLRILVLVYAPFAIMGVASVVLGMVSKAAGYALLGDFKHARSEISQVKLL